MLNRKSATLAAVVLITAALIQSVYARAIRVDSGTWDLSGFLSADSNQSIGFDFDFFGVSSSSVSISSDGSVSMSGGGESVSLFPFFDPAQTVGGNTTQYQYGTTNAAFSAAGVDAGFRVTWQVFDSTGTLLNDFQISLWDLAGDMFAFEFNYNGINFGDDGSRIGYETSLGDSFNLPGALGLVFADYRGNGDNTDFTSTCLTSPNALACNNYFDGTFGAGIGVLPDIANAFFRRTDANDDGAVGTVQGRYLFTFEVTDLDDDGDGVPDNLDLCPATAAEADVDPAGCSDAQVDGDGDGACDPGAASIGPSACGGSDNCPIDPNPDQANQDGDALGDACDSDDDNDGDSDVVENACGSNPFDAAETCANVDTDNDGVPDVNDVCPATVELAPTSSRGLGSNRWMLENGAFKQGPPQSGAVFAFTIEHTDGCSCSQIVEEAGLGNNHLKRGCSTSAMLDWINNP